MTYNRINLFLPTRKRVENGKLPRYLKSVMDTVSDYKNVVLTFLVDTDDVETEMYLYLNKELKCEFEIISNYKLKTPHLGKFYNILYEQTKFSDPKILVSMTGDDFVFVTKNWDLEILRNINDMNGVGIVHCKDGIQNGRVAVNLFTTRKWINMIGGTFMCELFPADFIDTLHTEIARRTGHERYLENVSIIHEHSGLSSPDTYDETFKRLRNVYNEEYSGKNLTHILESQVALALNSINGCVTAAA